MYCKKCGKPIDDGQTVCPECLAAEAPTPETPEAAPVQEMPAPEAAPVTPAPEQNAFDLNLSGAEAPKKDKKAKKEKKPQKMLFGKIPLKAAIISGVSLLAVIGIVCGFIFGGWWYYISDFFARTFQKPEEYKNTVEENALTREDSNSDLALAKRGTVKVYGALIEALGNGDGAAAISLRAELGDELTTLLNTAMTFTGGGDDMTTELLKTVRKLNADININTHGEFLQKDYAVYVNDQGAGIRDITDTANGKQYRGATSNGELVSGYGCYDLNAMPSALSIDNLVAVAQELPSEEEFSAMLDAFLMAAIREITDVEKENKSLKAAGVEQSFTVLTYTIDAATFQDISVAVLNEAAGNDTFRKFLNAYATLMEEVTGESLPVDNILAQFDALAESLEGSEIPDSGMELVIETYVDKKGFIQGRKFILDDLVGEKAEISYLTATGGFKQGFSLVVESEMGTALELEGTATLKNGLVEGSYDLKTLGQTVLTVKLKGFDPETLTGTIQIVPRQACIEILTDAQPLLSFIDLSSLTLEFQLGEGSVDVAAYLNNKLLASVGVSVGAGNGGSISIPTNVGGVTDEAAMEAWASVLETLDSIKQLLEKAGLGKLIDMMQGAVMQESVVARPGTESSTESNTESNTESDTQIEYPTVLIPGNGQVGGAVTMNPDGSFTVQYPDGTSTTYDPDGNAGFITLNPDGSTGSITLNPDGSYSVDGSSGVVTITPSFTPSQDNAIAVTPAAPSGSISYGDLIVQAEKVN